MDLDSLCANKEASPSKSNMTIKVPPGNEGESSKVEVPEASPEAAPTENVAEQKSKKNLKVLLIVGTILALAAIAIVVALVPDWGGETTTESAAEAAQGDNTGSAGSAGNDTTDNEETNGQLFSATTQRYFESNDGAFKIKIPLLSSNVTEPYTSIEEARHDLEQLAKLVVNDAIQQGQSMTFGDRVPSPGGPPEAALGSEAAGGDAAADNDAGSAFAGVDDFGTYQQEAGVVRSDFVKSNGVHIFAAKSDQILVWNLEGTLLKTVTMPAIDVTFVDEEFADEDMLNDEGGDSDSTTSSTAEARSMPIPWNPKPYIQALMLNPEGTRLTAIVGGYGAEYWTWNGVDIAPVIQDYKGTRIIVYDIQDDGTLTELSKTDINGYHLNSYSEGDNAHIVTKTGLNTWDYLEQPMQRWMPEYAGMSDEEYQVTAIVKAEEIIPIFVNKVMDLYATEGEVLLSRLAVFADSISDDSKMNTQVFGRIANSITEVNSFDMSASFLTDTFDVSTAATLQPGSWGYVYATNDWIWVADNGWRWIQEDGTYVQDTILLGFRLDGPSSTFSAFGTVPGTPLSQFSLDFYKDDETATEYIRVATTINFGWGIWWGGPANVDETVAENASRTKNQVIVMEVPTEDGLQMGNQLIQRGSVQLGKINEVRSPAKVEESHCCLLSVANTSRLRLSRG